MTSKTIEVCIKEFEQEEPELVYSESKEFSRQLENAMIELGYLATAKDIFGNLIFYDQHAVHQVKKALRRGSTVHNPGKPMYEKPDLQ